METTVWTYPWDLLDEGADAALATLRERAGATGVSVAAAYHAGKFLLPRNPRRRLFFPRSGTLYLPPGDWHGTLPITPPVWEHAAEVWPTLRERCDAAGLALSAWVLCLHNSGIGGAHPSCAVENAYGDRVPTDLCAWNPDVRAYVATMVEDVAARSGAERIVLESLEWMPLRHGFHHEVIGIPTGPTVDLLMSLCFCPHCEAACGERGVDLPRLRDWTRALLDRHFADPFAAGGPPALGWEELRAAADGALGGLLTARQDAIATLHAEIERRVRAVSTARLAALDFGPLYANGPDGRAWENGVDLARVAPLVDELHPTFYFTDDELHRRKVAEYVGVLGGERPIVPALRAILPQTDSAAALARQLAPLREHASEVSFYNAGFMAEPMLDWVREAVTGSA